MVALIAGKLPDFAKAGYGCGDGYSDVYGAAYGYGYGCGDSDADVDGYAAAYGYGYGYGDGDGAGAGYGEAYWQATIRYFAKKWGAAQRRRLRRLEVAGATIAFWKSLSDGKPANGGGGESAYPGLVQEVAGPLELCGPHALHATFLPTKWQGERCWIVALIGPVIHGDNKCGALKREIIGECL